MSNKTLFDEYAIAALTGLIDSDIAYSEEFGEGSAESLATEACDIALAMMEKRRKYIGGNNDQES